MKLYLILLVFITLPFAFVQVGYIDTVTNYSNSESKSIAKEQIVHANEMLTSSPFNIRFIFCNENNINTVQINFVNIKDKFCQNNNHNVLFNRYKIYFLQNILASGNHSYYKKLFYKLRILQI